MRRQGPAPTDAQPPCHGVPAALRPLALGLCASSTDGRAAGEDAASVEALMRELRASVASAMGTDFCYADLILPSGLHALAYQARIARDALASIGLVQPVDSVRDAGMGALRANGLGGDLRRDDNPPALILVVNYSHHHHHHDLTAQLFWRSTEGFVTPVREEHSFGGGLEAAREVLRAVVEPPFGDDPTYGDSGDPLPAEISHLVLHGDAATTVRDPAPQAPATAFEKLAAGVLSQRLLAAAVASDPVFGSAVFFAELAYDRVNDMAFGRKPAFGCCLWSRWHSCWEYRQIVHVCPI